MECIDRASKLYSYLRRLAPDETRILTEVLKLYKVRHLMITSSVDFVHAMHMLEDDPSWPFGHFFIGDSRLFEELYSLTSELSLGDFLKFYAKHKGIREFPHISGALMSEIIPEPLIANTRVLSLIGADAFITWVDEIVRRFPRTEFVLTSSSNPLSSELLAEMLFHVKNVRLMRNRETQIAPVEGELVVAFPLICPEKLGISFSYPPPEGLETGGVEMIARRMEKRARLCAIISERPLFSSKSRGFREWLISGMRLESIQSLPAGVLSPYSRMELSCLIVSKLPPAGEVKLVKYFMPPTKGGSVLGDVEVAAKRRCISTSRLQSERSWVVDRLLEGPEEISSSMLRASIQKARLIDVCLSIFRGTGALKGDVRDEIGDMGQTYGLIDMRDIQGGKLMLGSIQEIRVRDPRRLVRHEVYEGDVLVTCRSTSVKVALVPKIDRRLAISSNLICIRPRDKALGVILNAFLQSEVGMRMLESLLHGSMAKMIDPRDLESLPIPLFPDEEVRRLARRLEQAEEAYTTAVRVAEEERRKAYREVYEKLGLLI